MQAFVVSAVQNLPASLAVWRHPLPFVYDPLVSASFANGLYPEPGARSAQRHCLPQA